MLSLKTSTAMELLPVVCLCLLTRCGITSADGNGPAVVTVEQDRDVILPCSLSTKENIEAKLFDWKKPAQKGEKKKEVFYYDAGITYTDGRPGQSEELKYRVSHFPEELKHGNASIIIRNTKMADSGDYTCVFPLLQPRQTFHIKLVVDGVLKDRTDENIPGAAPKPVIRTLDETENWRLLQCEVHGNPQPEVEWRNSAGNTLAAEEPQVSERDGRFFITLNTTVTKTDHYRCVATQKNISHQIYTETFVRMTVETGNSGSGAHSSGSTGWIVAVALGVILFVVLGVGVALGVLVYKRYITRKSNKGSPADRKDGSEDALNGQSSRQPEPQPDQLT